jgi:hypothetical protein
MNSVVVEGKGNEGLVFSPSFLSLPSFLYSFLPSVSPLSFSLSTPSSEAQASLIF